MQFTAPLPFGTSRVPNPFLLFLPVFVEESPAKRIPKLVPNWILWVLAGPGVVTIFINLKDLGSYWQDKREFSNLQTKVENLQAWSLPIGREEFDELDNYLSTYATVMHKLTRLGVYVYIDLGTPSSGATSTFAVLADHMERSDLRGARERWSPSTFSAIAGLAGSTPLLSTEGEKSSA